MRTVNVHTQTPGRVAVAQRYPLEPSYTVYDVSMQALKCLGSGGSKQLNQKKGIDRHKELSRAAWQERERRECSRKMRRQSSWGDEQQARWEAVNWERLQALEAKAKRRRLAVVWKHYTGWVANQRKLKAVRARERARDLALQAAERERREVRAAELKLAKEEAEAREAEERLAKEQADVQVAEARLAAARAAADAEAVRVAEEQLARENMEAAQAELAAV